MSHRGISYDDQKGTKGLGPSQVDPGQSRASTSSLSVVTFNVITVNEQGKIVNQEKGQAEVFQEDLEGVPLIMVAIPGGSFLMGSRDDDDQAIYTEKPQHKVTVPPFFLGQYQVTQAQWEKVARWPKVDIDLKAKPSKFQGTDLPVECVAWLEAVEFCARLSQRLDRVYRLPSEAEWEYACRAGTQTNYHFGPTITAEIANFNGNEGQTTPTGSFKVANAFGLYDMHGNVWEWCEDPRRESYVNAPEDGKVWYNENETNIQNTANSRTLRVLRGGSWISDPSDCRSAFRDTVVPGNGGINRHGFRVASGLAR